MPVAKATAWWQRTRGLLLAGSISAGLVTGCLNGPQTNPATAASAARAAVPPTPGPTLLPNTVLATVEVPSAAGSTAAPRWEGAADAYLAP